MHNLINVNATLRLVHKTHLFFVW